MPGFVPGVFLGISGKMDTTHANQDFIHQPTIRPKPVGQRKLSHQMPEVQ